MGTVNQIVLLLVVVLVLEDKPLLALIGTMNLRIARQRLGLRQSSGAFDWLAFIAKNAGRLAHSKTWRGLRRSMDSLHDFDAGRRDQKPDRPRARPRPPPRNQAIGSRTRTRERRRG